MVAEVCHVKTKKIQRRVQTRSGATGHGAWRHPAWCPRDLGLNENLLSRWKKELLANGDSAFLGQGHARDQELMRLRRELAKVKKERDFLAEAAAYFAKGPK